MFDDPFARLPADARTQLTKGSAVILNWYAILDIPDDCEFLLGDVPPNLMVQINDAVRRDLTARCGEQLATLAQMLKALQRK